MRKRIEVAISDIKKLFNKDNNVYFWITVV